MKKKIPIREFIEEYSTIARALDITFFSLKCQFSYSCHSRQFDGFDGELFSKQEN